MAKGIGDNKRIPEWALRILRGTAVGAIVLTAGGLGIAGIKEITSDPHEATDAWIARRPDIIDDQAPVELAHLHKNPLTGFFEYAGPVLIAGVLAVAFWAVWRHVHSQNLKRGLPKRPETKLDAGSGRRILSAQPVAVPGL